MTWTTQHWWKSASALRSMVIYRPNSETRRVWRDWKSPVKSRALFIAAHRVRSDLTPAEHSARIDVWVAPTSLELT